VAWFFFTSSDFSSRLRVIPWVFRFSQQLCALFWVPAAPFVDPLLSVPEVLPIFAAIWQKTMY
jgi:hypothetical protein